MSRVEVHVTAGNEVLVVADGGEVVVPPPPPPPPPPVTKRNYVGVNLAGPDEWNAGARAKIFNDLWLTARCIDGNPSTGPSTWRVITVSNGGPVDVKGTYEFIGGPKNGQLLTITDNTKDVDVKFNTPVVGRIQLLRDPSSDMTTTPEFRNFMKPFSFIRFMDLMVTNWADEDDAAQRFELLGPDGLMQWTESPSDEGPYHRPFGISLQAAVRICNECNVDMWLNLQHVVTPQWLTGAGAELNKLNPGLKVIIAYSNEPWNYAGGFYHSSLIKEMAADYVADGTSPKLDNPPDNPWYTAARFQLMKLHEAWSILNPATGGRVYAVFESQYASGYYGNALMWSKRTYGNNDWLYGLACAPYIFENKGTVDEIIASLNRDYKSRENPGNKLSHMRGIVDAHLKNNNLFFYEVGIDMDQGDTNLTNRLAAAKDSRMQELVFNFLDSHFGWAGVAGAAWFNGCSAHNKDGPAWGATEDASDLTQPMYKGLADFAKMEADDGGVTARFYKDTNFTTLLEEKVVPTIFHSYQAWSSAPLHHGQNPTWTEGKDGSIRFTFEWNSWNSDTYLDVECEANDSISLKALPNNVYQVDYVARFSGNGSCYARLVEVYPDGTRHVVPRSQLKPA